MRLLACVLALLFSAVQPAARATLGFGHAWDGTRLLDDVVITIEDGKILSLTSGVRNLPDGAVDLRRYTAHWILDHVQEHEIHHRAMLNLYLRLLGVEPPSI